MPERHVSTETLAKLLLLSVRRVRQLTEQGVLQRARDSATGQELTALRAAASGKHLHCFLRDNRYADPDEVDYQKSRARRMSALADVEQLKLKRIRGEMHRAADVEFCLTQMVTACKQRSSPCCHVLQGKTSLPEITQILTDEIENALSELSEYAPAKFEAANEEYLAATGAAKPEARADRSSTFSPSGADLEKGL